MLSIALALSPSRLDYLSTLKVTNLQGKLQKVSVEVNRMKQFFDYDDPLIEPPANLDPVKDPPESDDEQFELVTEPCDDQPFDDHEQLN